MYDDNACDQECAELSPGEHCESSLKQCQCGIESSCIGTANPFCDKGECKGIRVPMIQSPILFTTSYEYSHEIADLHFYVLQNDLSLSLCKVVNYIHF